MALYVIAATTLIPSTSAACEVGTGGAAIAAGDAIYQDTADSNKWKLCDADSATTAAKTVGALAATACAADGCRLVVCRRDSALALGATTTQVMAAGDVLVLSNTAGKLQPAPASSGGKANVVGVASSATVINFYPLAGGSVA